MKKRMLAVVLLLCTVWVSCCGMYNVSNRYYVGDLVTFGTYEQDNNLRNGAEAIEWIVLDVQGNDLLLLSRYVLEAYRFHSCWAEITWDDSNIRSWLNDDFLYTAFTSSQRSMINTTRVGAECNPYFSKLDPGYSTKDKVFLLSVNEVESYLPKANQRMTSATDYARAHGAFISKSYTANGRGTAWWWLRSPGGYQGTAYKSYAAIIDGSGAVSGHEVYNSGYDGSVGGVRPAIWVHVS